MDLIKDVLDDPGLQALLVRLKSKIAFFKAFAGHRVSFPGPGLAISKNAGIEPGECCMSYWFANNFEDIVLR